MKEGAKDNLTAGVKEVVSVALSYLAQHPHSKIDLSGIGGLSPLNCYSGRRTSLPLMWVLVTRGGLLSPTPASSLASLSKGYLRNPEITIQSNCHLVRSRDVIFHLEILLKISIIWSRYP